MFCIPVVDNLPSPTGTSLSLKFDFDSVSMIGERSEVGTFKTVREAEENEASLTDSFGTLNLQQSEGEECVTNSFSLELGKVETWVADKRCFYKEVPIK